MKPTQNKSVEVLKITITTNKQETKTEHSNNPPSAWTVNRLRYSPRLLEAILKTKGNKNKSNNIDIEISK